MTVKDGFKFGVGLILAQFIVGLIALAISLPALDFVGNAVKQQAVKALVTGGVGVND